jgi:outer membrane protein OmpU
MNIKKIGLTALAASLVSVSSANAGEITASGAASMTVENYSSVLRDAGVAYSMADSVTLSGSGELDNGLTVSMSFELDSDNPSGSSYDNKSVSISSEELGTLTLAGHGGSSAVSAIDATAAGDIFDTFDTKVGVGASGTATTAETSSATGDAAMITTAAGDNSFMYTLPSMVDGLSVSASYAPQGSGDESSSAFAGTFTGVEGLSVSYGIGTNNSAEGTALDGDVASMKASYAFGPLTVAYSDHEFDSNTASRDQDVTSYSIAYTVSDELSITYGTETFDSGESATVDAEYAKISVAYTSGGMTLTAVAAEGENISFTTAAAEDVDYWGLTAAFAF